MSGALGLALPTLRALGLVAAITVLAFLCIGAVPGDVVDVLALQGDLTADQQAALREEMGVGRPLHERFLAWLGPALRGEFGQSLRFGLPVSELMWNALPTTLKLAGLSFGIGLLLAFVVAVGAIARPRSALPALVQAVNIWSVAVPTFCVGIAAILVFSIWLGWLPVIGNLWVPALILAIDRAGELVKPLYDELKEQQGAPHVRAARAKGLSAWRIGVVHVLPGAVPVLLALSSVGLAGLLGGSLTMEVLFGLPGIGSLTLNAVHGRDWPLLQAVVVLLATGVVLINALADLLHRLVDPRPRR
ncbi:ABC transporter permease [Roseomonas eburnea]|uniref:ABC transporter permease n=1 Tax=Neoroseomonas eburnea TaxID=1346889 RepID=A0A9X9XE51_9PROT|nr:ABC transporter permease [Neoroseomonas eburnea]